MSPTVIYRDDNFLVLNKPADLIVHGASPSVAEWLLKNFPEVKIVGDKPEERPGIVHRLDKDTSGILVVARNQKAFDYLKKLFQEHQVKKTYLALVYGHLKEKEGIINRPLGIVSGSVKRTIHVGHARLVKEAITKYKVKKELELNGQKVSLIEVEPLTGRTHQIRVHLASLGHSVVGDKLYGPKKPSLKLERQFLHADSIEFTKPDGGRLRVSVGLSEELARLIT